MDIRLKQLVLAFLFTAGLNAQSSNFSATLSYPLPLVDTNFNDYTGIADVGLQYGFYESGRWQLGASLSGAYFVQSTDFINPTFTLDENILLLQPKVFAAASVSEGKEFMPFVAVGYALAIYSLDYNIQNAPPDENEAKGGLNLSAGAIVELTKRLFAIAHYDYINFSDTSGGLNIDFSENLGMAKLGLGYRF
ncbi:porin family protein [Flagellimonas sp. 389]|uniref:outer membrane protein n=1 Tax=Flagellimonas sp. 389 TaxID=2835862 RepID=UPI001BD53939|nr:outer membrane beta-barrel protein [Flagellimonas sp. 389]MBS9462831.1 porin family protein [Flagellimonas sp. 389]